MTRACRNCPDLAAAWVRFPGGITLRLCVPCLDAWFDRADDHPELEPRIWGWLFQAASRAVAA